MLLKAMRILFRAFGLILPPSLTANFIVKAVVRRLQDKELKPYQAELIQLQKYLETKGRGMVIIFEGRDAAGKGGTIRRVTRYMNEKHYRIVALGKPSEQDKKSWYFQRYTSHLPREGEVVLFDRSWYNRAMVEKVFRFCTDEEYKVFMKDVQEFERSLKRRKIILVKLYFSVSKEEQARRFERRKTDPLRMWKLSEVDVQAQERWDDFTKVKFDMLRKTDTTDAPWTIIRSDNKHEARLNSMKVILNSAPFKKESLEGSDLVPDSKVNIPGPMEFVNMKNQRLADGTYAE
jgi:polyphosphate kinase 2